MSDERGGVDRVEGRDGVKQPALVQNNSVFHAAGEGHFSAGDSFARF